MRRPPECLYERPGVTPFLPSTSHQSRITSHVVLPVLCFHHITNPSSSNTLLFTSIQNPRGVTPPMFPQRLGPPLCVVPVPQTPCPQRLAACLPLFALFSALVPFVFKHLQPFCQNTGGGNSFSTCGPFSFPTCRRSAIPCSVLQMRLVHPRKCLRDVPTFRHNAKIHPTPL
jgi:hypothetical protein